MIEGFGERISSLRIARGLTAVELGKQLQLSGSMISRYESDERLPSFKVLLRMAKFFGVTTDFMLGLDSKQEQAGNGIFLDVTGLTTKQIAALRMMVEQCQAMNSTGE